MYARGVAADGIFTTRTATLTALQPHSPQSCETHIPSSSLFYQTKEIHLLICNILSLYRAVRVDYDTVFNNTFFKPYPRETTV
jgi:hypothetical protein